MAPLTERIASVSLPTILLILVCLTALRVVMHTSRVALFRACADLLESVILAIGLVFLLLRPFVVQSFFIPSGSMEPTLWEGDHILVNKWVYRTHPPQRGDILVFRAPHHADPSEKDFIKRLVGLPGDRIEVREGFVVVGRGDTARIYTTDTVLSHLCDQAVMAQEEATEAEHPGQDAPLWPRLRLMTDAIWLGDRRVEPEEFAQAVGRPGEPVMIQPGRVLRNGEVLIEYYIAEDPHYHMDETIVPQGHLFTMGDNRNDSRDSHVWGTFPMERVVGRADCVFWPPPHLKRLTP